MKTITDKTKRKRTRTPNNKTTTAYRISDDLWAVLEPLLPVQVNLHRFGGGRPRVPDRLCADAIFGYPRKTGQLEDSHRDLKCRKARPRWLRIQKPEALMLQSVPPYVDTPIFYVLRTGCQWQGLDQTELCAHSTAHDRYQQWVQADVFLKLWRAGVNQFDELQGLDWAWLSMDGTITKAPLGG
jgi:putative transposase